MQPDQEDPEKQPEFVEPIEEQLEEQLQATPPQETISTPNPAPFTVDTVVSEPKSHKRRMLIIVLIVVLLALVGGGVYWWFATNNQPAPVAQNQPAVSVKPSESPITDPVLAAFITPKTGEKWLAAPKKISDPLGYVYEDESEGLNQVTYYEVGSRGDSTIILADIPGTASTTGVLFERAKDGTVSYIAHPIGNGDYTKDSYGNVIDDNWPQLAKKVKRDTATHYDSLTAPAKLAFGSNQFVNVELNYPTIGTPITTSVADGTKETTAKTYGQSKLQKVERQYVDTKLTAINYVLDLPSGTGKDVTYKPITEDLSAYTWDNGVAVGKSDTKTGYSSEIGGVVRGCGAVGNAVTRVDDAKDTDFVAAGKTPAGQTVYAFKDSNNHVVQAVYKDYKTAMDEGNTPTITLDLFVKNHGIVAFKDSDGTWLVYSRDQFALLGGCGKPVVYLYPTKTQAVNVRIGADVSISAPLYNPTTGWNVIAQPNGQLTVNGQQFDSLFWEGTGHGLYPGITAGTIVKNADAAATMRAQLLKQGLNQKETNDFLAFWQPRIPKDPYIRLTWFNTAQLDQLAPLTISPKPDTTIRVFLDMAGYSSPVNIPAQKLTSTARKGFTVVEWGGLLSGGIIAR